MVPNMKRRIETDPTFDTIALIDEEIILNRIRDEWSDLSNKALKKIAKRLEEKYGYEVGWYGSDGIGHIKPTYELRMEISKSRLRNQKEREDLK